MWVFLRPPSTSSDNLTKLFFQVDALSELFVAWDDVLTETENKVIKLERDREERQRLGYE
jgi:hypothetical protein